MSKSGFRPAIATGTRADWGLLLPLARELRGRSVTPMIAATHAHFFDELGNTYKEIENDGFEISCRIPTRRTPVEALADAAEGFGRFLREKRPSVLIILGDRFEMLGAASAALLERVPIVHIAGGNVTKGAYDDAIRDSISRMATLHLPETQNCAERLIRLGADPERVVNAGSAGVWSGLHERLLSLPELEESLGFGLGDDFFVATLHAATLDSLPPIRRMEDFLEACSVNLSLNPGRKMILTYPNSDSDPAPLIAAIEGFARRFPGRVLTIPSLGRIRYLSAAALATAVIGNSSSGIEEVPSLGTPTLDIGRRQDGRERGPGVLHVADSADDIIAGLEDVASEAARTLAAKRENPYYKDNTPGIQADAICRMFELS